MLFTLPPIMEHVRFYSILKVRELKNFASYYFPLINNRNFSVWVNIFSFKCNLFSPLERSFER